MQLLDDYNKTRNEIFEYFGYKEDWVVIPLEDGREYHWCLDGTGPGTLHYADTLEMLVEEKDNYYTSDIYTQRFLPKWVYRAKDYTMVVIDTRCDGNKFLMVLDNSKEYIRPHMQIEKILKDHGYTSNYLADRVEKLLTADLTDNSNLIISKF